MAGKAKRPSRNPEGRPPKYDDPATLYVRCERGLKDRLEALRQSRGAPRPSLADITAEVLAKGLEAIEREMAAKQEPEPNPPVKRTRKPASE